MEIEAQIITLLIVSVLVALAARRIRVPYTIAMVITGLFVSFLREGSFIDGVELEPHLIFVTFLPGLLFEAAFHLSWKKLKSNLKTILLLAIPGVLLSTFIVGYLLSRFLSLPIEVALLFGVLISATDPIAVVALFKEVGVNKRLATIVEGESLFNDGAAIVIFGILAGIATGEAEFNLAGSILTFFVTVGGGAVLGYGAGILVSLLMQREEDHVLDLALTAILAYGTYLFAEEVLHGLVSPVIAVVVAAITLGDRAHKNRRNFSVLPVAASWEFITFLINSAIFLLIGMTINPAELITQAVPVLITIAVVLFARALVVYPLRWLANRFIRPLSLKWTHVLWWGGLRGAVSLALVLSLPESMPSRDFLTTLAFGYVLFSLLVQAAGIRPLLAKLGMTSIHEKQREYEVARARMGMAHAAIRSIDNLHSEDVITGQIERNLHASFRKRVNQELARLRELIIEDPSLAVVDARYIQHQIVIAQKQALERLAHEGLLSQSIALEMAHKSDELIKQADEEDWNPTEVLAHGLPALATNGNNEESDEELQDEAAD